MFATTATMIAAPARMTATVATAAAAADMAPVTRVKPWAGGRSGAPATSPAATPG